MSQNGSKSAQERPKGAPRAPKSVQKSIFQLFNDFWRLPKGTGSALRASKNAPGASGNGPGTKKEAKIGDLGVIWGSILKSFWDSKRVLETRRWKM